MRHFFVTGIGTEVGKTITSAILTEALKADYWKPVQAGDLDFSDTLKVKALISNTRTVFHEEAYRLSLPMSPHAAAKVDNVRISLDRLNLPTTSNTLLIEGAGGVLVPLNDELLMLDLIAFTKAEVVLVAQNYLGSINHTLLTYEALKQRSINIIGIVFNGKPAPETENYILNYTQLPCILRIEEESEFTPEVVRAYSKKVNIKR